MLNNRPTALLVRGGLKSVVNSNDRTQTEKVSAKNKATDNQGATTIRPEAKRDIVKGEIEVIFYKEYYYIKVDANLTSNIKKLMFEPNRGHKGYKTPTIKRIMKRFEEIGLVYYVKNTKGELVRKLRAHVSRSKVEFKQAADGTCIMPFIGVNS